MEQEDPVRSKTALGFFPTSFFGRSKIIQKKDPVADCDTNGSKTTSKKIDESKRTISNTSSDITNKNVPGESRNDELDDTITGNENDDTEDDNIGQENEKIARKSTLYFDNIGSKFLKLVKVGGGGIGMTSKKSKDYSENEQVLSDIVATVRDQIEQGSDSELKDTLPDIIKLMNSYRGKMTEVAQKYLGSINFNKLSPTAVLYYIEREDETKNPSWKRRQHRYNPELKMEKVHELYDALQVAKLCYADTADEIRSSLLNQKVQYELVYVNVQSSPGQPANFLAVQRDQHSFRRGFNQRGKVLSSTLRVIIGVRGTKTTADAITDLLCDTVEYNGGTAHAFIVESGKYLANKHRALIEDLRIKSGKKKVVVTLIGHSLGAGAASIAGMELHNYANASVTGRQSIKSTMQVKVIGFGCPAIVSENLAREATYITTVINDADVVPRMSGITVTNLLLDIMSFNWMEYVQRDIQYTLNELQRRHSRIFKETTRQKITETIESILQKHLQNTMLKDRPEPRMVPEVYPPGQCIHLYRDGCGITGCYVPNTYFSDIDISRRMIDGTSQIVRVALFRIYSCGTDDFLFLFLVEQINQTIYFILAMSSRCWNLPVKMKEITISVLMDENSS
jgi:Lipase (class 3)